MQPGASLRIWKSAKIHSAVLPIRASGRARITPAGLGGVENLGEPINTPGDEMFPTFRPNGDFYFSSNGHVGMGGLDIYIAKVNSITRKYELTHPGYPLNTEADDFGMTFEGLHNQGFFCSNRKRLRSYLLLRESGDCYHNEGMGLRERRL